MAGAGTSTRELLEQAGPLDLVLIPAGGGGQLVRRSGRRGGGDRSHRGSSASSRPRSGSGGRRWTPAARRRSQVGRTIADGQQLPSPGELHLRGGQATRRGRGGVSDEQMLAAMRYLFERQKLVVEPSGSSALAAVLSGLVDVRGLRVGVVLSGGNIAVERFVSLLAGAALSASPRRLRARARARLGDERAHERRVLAGAGDGHQLRAGGAGSPGGSSHRRAPVAARTRERATRRCRRRPGR